MAVSSPAALAPDLASPASAGSLTGRARQTLSLDKTTRLVARALGMSAEALTEGLRPVTPGDLPAVMALRQQVLGSALSWDDRAYLRWRYAFDPAALHLAQCWILMRGDDLLAMIGLEPVDLRAQGRVQTAHVAMDIMVRPDLDGSGLGVWINQSVCARLGCLLAVGSNINSRSVIARTFETMPDRRSWHHPLRFGHFMRKRVGPGPLSGVLAGVADIAGVVWRKLTWGLPSSGIKVEPVSRLAPDVAAWLESVGHDAHDGQVRVARSAERWAHRILANPRTRCSVWLAREAGRPVGLLATRLMPLDEGRCCVHVLDLVMDGPAASRSLRALMAAAASSGHAAGAAYLSISCYDAELEARLAGMQFVQQGNAFETMAWHCADEGFVAAVNASRGWSLMDLHTDRDSA
jgi:hypothetical protein